MDVGSGALLALCLFKPLPQKIRMSTLVNEAEDEERVTFNLVVDEVRKGPAFAARESMWSDVVSALPLDHGAHRLLHPIVEIAAKPLRNLRIV